MFAHLSLAGLTFDTPIPYHAMSEFWHPNASDSDMEAAWDAIDTNALPIALHHKFAKSAGLPASTHFPWDTERSIYYIKGIHDLHCLVGPLTFFQYFKLMKSPEIGSQGHCF